jgi:hypothetical protein
MITKYYTCQLLSDLVLNNSLATDGTMTSLDYIPGSNFLGVVASKVYPSTSISNEMKYSLFHSGDVSFGDGNLTVNQLQSFPVPFSYYMDKLNNKIGEDLIYLHHLINDTTRPKNNSGTPLQLQQIREGNVLEDLSFLKRPQKKFSLKSAQDRNTRSSKDGALFGFDALQNGQEFIFSICYKNEELIAIVEHHLIGTKRLGKSKNAEFGQVLIRSIEISSKQQLSEANGTDLIVYAQSNLCFTDEETGNPTFRPTIKQLGLEKGEINWNKSQIRTFSYSPWNTKRNTNSTQRHCIARGSVFVVEGSQSPIQETNQVGGYNAEGLGRIIYNPFFLSAGDKTPQAKTLKIISAEKTEKEALEPKSVLGLHLKAKKDEKLRELAISKHVASLLNEKTTAISSLKEISSSQWGNIRAIAGSIQTIAELKTKLFDENDGYLKHGVAYDRYWGKKGRVNHLEKIVDANKDLGPIFIQKFAAEMAKKHKN